MGRYIISVLLLLVSFAVSIGTIFAEDERTGDVDKDIVDMVERADRALYRVKHELGGDQALLDEESP